VELEREAASGGVFREQARHSLNELDSSPARRNSDILGVFRRAAASIAPRQNGSLSRLARPASPSPGAAPPGASQSKPRNVYEAAAPPVPKKIFWEPSCPVCMGTLLQPPSTVPMPSALEPGFLACGHLLCEECFVGTSSRQELLDANGRLRCPVCREPSTHRWHSLLAKPGDAKTDGSGWRARGVNL